ncbi:hypothetical protein BDN71DRAFT_1438502 [Pleurotus eryngii]|uniref:Uncharacterized protein n=1 Tax=Pleurotus eryngii TaxID=5323 RepID=A0A9P6DK31_PLEER|nr:hypothetical protein BDN71DRAFT_1438502 [Pleurotus eryngii]
MPTEDPFSTQFPNIPPSQPFASAYYNTPSLAGPINYIVDSRTSPKSHDTYSPPSPLLTQSPSFCGIHHSQTTSPSLDNLDGDPGIPNIPIGMLQSAVPNILILSPKTRLIRFTTSVHIRPPDNPLWRTTTAISSLPRPSPPCTLPVDQ